jgi:hypothetical protein
MERVTLVCGMAQQGKTTLALRIVEDSDAPRVIILDPVRSKPFNHIALQWRSWAELAAFLHSDASGGKWIGCLRSIESSDYTAALHAARYYRHTTLLVDEALTFASDPEALPPLVVAARANAHFGNGIGVPLVLTAQRPGDLPPDVRSQVTGWYSFRQEEPRDLQYLSLRCSPDFALRVAELEPHKYLVFPPTEAAVNGDSYEQGEARSGIRAGGARGAGVPPDVPEAESDSETPGAHEVSVPRERMA